MVAQDDKLSVGFDDRGEHAVRRRATRRQSLGGFADGREPQAGDGRQAVDQGLNACVQPIDVGRTLHEGTEPRAQARAVEAHVEVSHAMVEQSGRQEEHLVHVRDLRADDSVVHDAKPRREGEQPMTRNAIAFKDLVQRPDRTPPAVGVAPREWDLDERSLHFRLAVVATTVQPVDVQRRAHVAGTMINGPASSRRHAAVDTIPTLDERVGGRAVESPASGAKCVGPVTDCGAQHAGKGAQLRDLLLQRQVHQHGVLRRHRRQQRRRVPRMQVRADLGATRPGEIVQNLGGPIRDGERVRREVGRTNTEPLEEPVERRQLTNVLHGDSVARGYPIVFFRIDRYDDLRRFRHLAQPALDPRHQSGPQRAADRFARGTRCAQSVDGVGVTHLHVEQDRSAGAERVEHRTAHVAPNPAIRSAEAGGQGAEVGSCELYAVSVAEFAQLLQSNEVELSVVEHHHYRGDAVARGGEQIQS